MPVLRRELSLRSAVALGVGGTIGGGIYVLIGRAVAVAGPAAVVSFAVAFAGALLIALPYAELACRYPVAGGGYAFARAVFGRHVGFVMGWTFWGAYLFISGYVTLGFGGYLHALLGVPRLAGALALIAACLALGVGGVRLTGAAQAGVTALAIAGLVLFALWGAPEIRSRHFSPFAPTGLGGVLSAALLAFLAFGGFDMVAAAGEEIRDPERNVPRAILITLVTVLGLYVVVCLVAIGTVGAGPLGASSAPLADAARRLSGTVGQRMMTATALLTTAATANAVLVVTSRISFAMARDGLLPAALAKVSPDTGAPVRAVAASAALLALVAAAGSIAVTAAVGGFLYVVHFALPLGALVALRRRGGDESAVGFRAPVPLVSLPLAFVACGVLLVAAGSAGAAGGVAWIAVGAVGYLAYMCRNIRTLHNFDPPATEEEIRSAALQYVRKISGYNKPSQANEAAFAEAVEAVAQASARLLSQLHTTAPPKDRETEAAKARARAAQRFAA
jgi:APA family basic amino acid/polyamine antiporter